MASNDIKIPKQLKNEDSKELRRLLNQVIIALEDVKKAIKNLEDTKQDK